MRVKATKLGIYKAQRRHAGDVFDIPKELFSRNWMDSLEPGDESAMNEELARLPHSDLPAEELKRPRGRPRSEPKSVL